ncbi:helix-turn-helix transcriptional regulator [Ferrimonas marina]|uniref:AraC-type DNA-binding protein n=1 Tax=Ferrimonas marina TaxID=299255 RepID=A0A1M5P803_9GAMM|nr:AraC family transcriptional regulator [Ferrimonas marina]SHG97827.1 AraC-type DNA-binding protein [Ferrimonas marina]
MKTLPIGLAKLASPFLHYLQQSGHNPALLRQMFPFEQADLEGCGRYLPSYAIGLVAEGAAQLTGKADLGFRAAEVMGFSVLPQPMRQAITQSDDVLTGLVRTLEQQHLLGSHARLEMSVSGNLVTLSHQSALSVRSRGHDHATNFTTAMLLALLRHYFSDQWTPMEIGMADRRISPELLQQQTGCSQVLEDSDQNQIRFWLSQASEEASLQFEQNSEPFERLMAVMNAYWRHPQFSLEFVAHLFGVSERTVQRLLARHGVRFRDYHNGKKAEEAQNMLRRGQTVAQVAEQLGYSDPSNFSRALKRQTRCCPSVLRATN